MLRKLRARADWPFGGPPWSAEQVAGIEAWRARNIRNSRGTKGRGDAGTEKNGKGNRASVEDLLELTDAELDKLLGRLWSELRAGDYAAPVRADALLKVERILQVRQGRAIQAGDYLVKAEVERRDVLKVQALKTALLQLPRAAAPLLVGLEAGEIEDELTRRVRLLLEGFARGAGSRVQGSGKTATA